MLVSSTNAERWKVFGANNNSLSERVWKVSESHLCVWCYRDEFGKLGKIEDPEIVPTVRNISNVLIVCQLLLCQLCFLIVIVCFAPQESEGGLYVCMNTFLGFGREHVERHYRKTGQSVYMHLKRHVKEVRLPPAPCALSGVDCKYRLK